jgi:DNA-binding transcriptional ArsR family regulator
MSARSRSGALPVRTLRAHAPVFAALGDPLRLALVSKLSSGEPLSIVELTHGMKVTRQAVTKHLRVLEDAGVVSGERQGRSNLYALRPHALDDARRSLEAISRQWAQALGRLQAFVERD